MLLGSSSGCRRDADEDSSLVLRFIDEDPADKLTRVSYLDVLPAFDWTFESREDLAPWRGLNQDLEAAFHGQRLRIHFPATSDLWHRPSLVRQVDFDAGAVDLISIQIAGSLEECPGAGHTAILWAGPDQDFSAERSMDALAVQDGGYTTGTATFSVRDHPNWKGHISSIRIDVAFTPGCTIELRAVRGSKYEVNEELFADALTRPWKVTLENDLRNALLAPPGQVIERQLEVPPDAVFSFSYGVDNRAAAPVDFQVLAEEGGKRERLFGASLSPDSLYADRGWREAEVDLSRFAGKRVTLLLETSSTASFNPLNQPPAWGNPEVWRRSIESSRPNVILISLDTLRADHLSLYGYDQQTSPNIDRWARESGVTFENAVAPSPWTLPSHTSLFTGLNALQHGVNHDYAVPGDLTLMAELFRKASYSTMAVTGGVLVSPDSGFDQGFDRFRAWGVGSSRDREMATGIDEVIRWLRAPGRRPFFLFFHTYEIHGPYQARQPFYSNFTGSNDAPPGRLAIRRERELTAEEGFSAKLHLVKTWQSREPVSPEEKGMVDAMYDSGIAYADHQLARLFDVLDDLDLRRRTIVVLVSDHGEALGDHDLAGHTHLYDFNLKVPLVVALPDGRYAGRRISEQVSLVDVLPTVLELAGIPSSLDFDGSSLVSLLEGKAAGRREAWSYAPKTNVGISLRVSNRLKYIYNNTAWVPPEGREELYRLDVDPNEESNVIATAPEAEGLRRLVRERLASGISGLRVQVANDGQKPLSGSLDAPFLRPWRVKVLDPPCTCLFWDDRAEALRFEVPAGEALALFLEGIGPGDFELKAQGEGSQTALDWRRDPQTLDGPQAFAFDGSSWTEVRPTSDRPSSTGIMVDWHGTGAVSSPYARDESMVKQLQALGYLN